MKGNDEAVEVFLDYERDLDVLARPVTSVQGQDRPMVEWSQVVEGAGPFS